MGKPFCISIMVKCYTTIIVILVIVAFLTHLGFLFADIFYAVADLKIRIG